MQTFLIIQGVLLMELSGILFQNLRSGAPYQVRVQGGAGGQWPLKQ